MATWRKRSKVGGITRTSTDKGWTTSTSYGAGKKNGVGYRVTTTNKANGKTVVRTTERGGQGWHKTTQRTLSSRDPYKITKRDLNNWSKSSGHDPVRTFIIKWGLIIWGASIVIEWIQGWFK
jgi:hypothetical protein